MFISTFYKKMELWFNRFDQYLQYYSEKLKSIDDALNRIEQGKLKKKQPIGFKPPTKKKATRKKTTKKKEKKDDI